MAVKKHNVHFDVTAQDGASRALKTVESSLKGVQNAANTVSTAFKSVLAATGAVSFGTAMIKSASEAEQASNRLQATLRATGGSAAHTKEELDELAESMQRSLGFNDESVRNAQSTLLKFGNIHGDVFRNALKLSGDLAAFMGTDVPEAAQMIGKSLQSPTEGLTMMERQFGKLTDAQEKHINDLVKQGRAIEAQSAILELWKTKVGGVAEEMNTGILKATRDVGNAWDDLLESLGKTEIVGGTVKGMLGGIRDILRDITSLVAGEKGDPFQKQNERLAELQDNLQRLMATRGKGWGGQNPEKLAQVDAAIAANRAEQRSIVELMRAQQEQDAFEKGMQGSLKETVLGGKDGTAEEEARRKAEAARRLAENERVARQIVDGEEELQKTITEAQETWQKQRAEAEKRAADDNAAMWKQVFKEIDDEQDREIQRGAELLEALKVDNKALKEKDELWKSLGMTMSSYFEKSLFKIRSWADVLESGKALLMDIVQISARELVTKPIGTAIAGGVQSVGSSLSWDKLFGGDSGAATNGGFAFAEGGNPPVGRPYLVGEKGPEVRIDGGPGTIIPNHALGGTTYAPVINVHFSANTPAAVRDAVFSMLPAISEAASGRTLATLQASGRL